MQLVYRNPIKIEIDYEGACGGAILSLSFIIQANLSISEETASAKTDGIY